MRDVRNSLENTWFENPQDGQRFRILSLPTIEAPGTFVLEYVYQPFTGETAVPPHFHPTSTESFEILSGSARYRIGGVEGSAGAGDRIVMPPNTPHVHPWSGCAEPLHVRQTGVTNPADPEGIIASIQAQITLYGLARDGKLNRSGIPNPLQLGVLIHTTMPATYIAGPPASVQRLAFALLARLGGWFGYRTSYPAYGTLTAEGLSAADSQAPR
ncbi:MAG: cupin domain-containing protein [Gemmatimonadota bacterium]